MVGGCGTTSTAPSGAAPAATAEPCKLVVRLLGGEELTAGSFDDRASAKASAQELVARLSSAEAAGDWWRAAFRGSSAWAEEPAVDLSALLEQATRLEEGGDLAGAAEKYRLASADRVLTLRASIMQANVEMKLGRAEPALAALDRALALTKPETFYRELVSELRVRAVNAVSLHKRIDELRGKLLETERDFDVLSDIGSLQVKAGDLKGAEETMGQMASTRESGRETDVLRARLIQAWCRRGLGRAAAAFEEFDRLVVEARGKAPEVGALAQFERAKTLQLRGRAAQALDDYRSLAATASGLGPAGTAALQFQVAWLLKTELNRPAEGRDAFRALASGPLKGQPYAKLARAMAGPEAAKAE